MSTYRKNPEALDTAVGETQVVFNVDSLKYFQLSDVASRMWELLSDGGMTAQQLNETLVREYDVSEAECAEALDVFLSDAVAKGLVVID